MTSEAQKLAGYPIPQVIQPEETRCIIVTIPDDDGYYNAVQGQLLELGKWWNWQRTSRETKEASLVAQQIRNVMTFTERTEIIQCVDINIGGETMTFTLEELTDAMCQAVECGIVNVASRVLSGQAGNTISPVTIEQDGTITIKDVQNTSGVEGSPEQLTYGGWIEVRKGLDEFFFDLETYYGTGYNRANTESLLSSEYATSSKLSTAVDQFYTYRDTNPALGLNFTNLEKFTYNEPVRVATVSEWVIDNIANETLLVLEIVSALSENQISEWYVSGLPRDGFQSADKYRNPPEQFIIYDDDGSNRSYPVDIPYNRSVGALYLVKVTGKIQIDPTTTYDGYYIVDETNNTRTYAPIQLTFKISNISIPKASPSAQPSYAGGDGYSVEYQKPVNNAMTNIRWTSAPLVATSSGKLELSLIDLGNG